MVHGMDTEEKIMDCLLPPTFESQSLVAMCRIIFYSMTAIVAMGVAGSIVIAEIFKGRILSLFTKEAKNGKRN